jgi:phosphate starvation-inducible protein PhoH and related proteins
LELNVTLERGEARLKLFGPADRNLKLIRESLDVQIFARDGQIRITGSPRNVARAAAVVRKLQRLAAAHEHVSPSHVAEAIAQAAVDEDSSTGDLLDVYMPGQVVRPKTPGQKDYIDAIRTHDMVFCVGPAGTGKTYLAVAMAVHLLKHERMKRLILARPAVEAGEKLGFLPGDMQAKVNPYLRPLFDALHDMMAFDQIKRFMTNDLIEVIPLAFMRGRTLNDCIIILDEAQNTTVAQMLMFLTRMGHGSKVVVTGDDSQSDLPAGTPSGLNDARKRLSGIKGIAMVTLNKMDIVRHRLVQTIVEAYERRGGAAVETAPEPLSPNEPPQDEPPGDGPKPEEIAP